MKPEQNHVYIIAEAGVNHNGNEDTARALVDIAVDAQADAVKFQLFNPDSLVTHSSPTADYQARNLGDDQITQRDMLRALMLPKEAYVRLQAYCTGRGIDFICTPFDQESLDYLTAHTQMPCIKFPSGEITNGPLLLSAARSGLPVILSTGMSDLNDVAAALSVIYFGKTSAAGNPNPAHLVFTPAMTDVLSGHVTLLHCVSQYPAPVEATNLRAMDTLHEAFGLPVGLSDHTLGITVPVAAVARGATVIEKHFTYDKHASGPDHKASLSPEELKAMVTALRDTGKALGDGVKQCQPEELSTQAIARKSLVAASAITKGQAFTEQNITAKRPGSGALVPNQLWALLGKPAKSDYAVDDFIHLNELS